VRSARVGAVYAQTVSIRFLLLPWWLHTVVLTVFIWAGAVVAVRYMGQESGEAHVPALDVALIGLGAVALAALMATVLRQTRDRYFARLSALSTPEQRSQALRAAWRGPVPENAGVRQAAERLVADRLDNLRRSWLLVNLCYPAFAVFWLWMATYDSAHHLGQRLLHGALALMFLWSTAWSWVWRRRLRTRLALLRHTAAAAEVTA
jgi:hypothetical protein